MKGLEPWNIWVGLSQVAPNDLPESSAKVWSAAWGLGPEIGFPEVGPRIGNHLEPLGTMLSFVSLANHSPSRHCPRLHQDSVILLADDDDAVPCEISAKAGKTCLFTCVYVYIISYDYICVYVVINNRHRYIAWQYGVCKGTAHIGTCVPTYIQTYDCVCVCLHKLSQAQTHIHVNLYICVCTHT